METLWKDLRYSLRMLRNRPMFTAITALSLALGIGANSAIFSVINAVMLRPLPYREPERLVMLWEHNLKTGRDRGRVAPDNFVEWRKNNRIFEEIAAVFALEQKTLTGAEEPEQVQLHQVSANFFPLLGVQAALGRVFSQQEDLPHVVGKQETPHGDRVIILSHGLWQRRFGGDSGVVGKTVELDGESHTVIGVLAPGFRFIDQPADVWTPLGLDPGKAYFAAGFGRFLWAPAKLKAGVTLEQAREEMKVIAGQTQQKIPVLNTGFSVNVLPFDRQVAGDIRRTLLTLLGAVSFVLLIACANVANIRLAQATTREKEIAIRASLGANRPRLIRQLLTENLVLAAIGGALGLLLAFGLVRLLVALGPTNIPRLSELEDLPLDGIVLGFTLGVSLLAGIISGLAPAWQASKLDLNGTLKEGGKSATSSERSARLRSIFIVAEIALALVLLIGAGLMIRSFLRLQSTDPGFNPHNLLTMRLLLPSHAYPAASNGKAKTAFFEQAIKRIEALPGAQSASVISMLPLGIGGPLTTFNMPVMVEGLPTQEAAAIPRADIRMVNSNYFRTMGIPLRMGRDFTEREISDEAARVIVINETFARRLWPNENPLGRRVRLNRADNPLDEVIGVVGDVKNGDLDAEVTPTVYWPHHSWAFAFGTVLVRTTLDPASLTSAVTREIHSIDPGLAIADIRTMEDVLWRSIGRPRFNTLLLAVLAVVGLALAVVGIYGVMSYAVSQRTHEIGIRIALGARPPDVFKLVLRQGMALTLIGVGIGLAASLALTRALFGWLGWLYGVRPTDPATFIGVPLLLTAVALLACYIPARRATKLDPMETLRHE
ncbi:MAG TPA: ABC transporter permease [Blastocatellia bacterium]|nr:ABC transporter permease [Blastocatellia bacterium]